MQYQIFVQSQSKQHFVASVIGIPNLTVEGRTEEEVITKAKAAVEAQLATGWFVEIEVNPNGIPNHNVSLVEKPFYKTATDEEWEAAIADFVSSTSVSKTPLLSDEAISRESIYQERDYNQL